MLTVSEETAETWWKSNRSTGLREFIYRASGREPPQDVQLTVMCQLSGNTSSDEDALDAEISQDQSASPDSNSDEDEDEAIVQAYLRQLEQEDDLRPVHYVPSRCVY